MNELVELTIEQVQEIAAKGYTDIIVHGDKVLRVRLEDVRVSKEDIEKLKAKEEMEWK